MSFGKRFQSNKSQTNDKEIEIKLRLFERLSQKGFLQSLQQQMRSAIAQEFNDCQKQTVATNGEIEVKPQVSEDKETLDPLEKLSSIANWEKQIRYELEIDREIQFREIERQKEKLKTELRKLNERDKCLRIELDSRERKIRLREEELIRSTDELNEKLTEMSTKEEMIDSIVNQKIKSEMKEEMEKLKKKFNELEINKLNLIKREEKIKEVEQRLHSQVQIVKEKIDNKKLSEIELAKSRKDLEIIRKENEVLRQRVDSMGDYPLTKFENKSLKSELNVIKDSLKNKFIESESQREKLEKVIKQSDERVLNLTMDLRKSEQELLMLKQKHQGVIDQYDNKLEQLNNQLEQAKHVAQQLQHKNHLLSKEIIKNTNEKQNILKCNQNSNNNITQTDGQKFGCFICDHNINTLEESSVDFLVTQTLGLGFDRHLINKQNLDLNLKSSSLPSKNMKPIEPEVPLNDKTKTTPTTDAILHNTSAKYNDSTDGNRQTIGRKEEDIKSDTNVLINNKHNVDEDYGKDINNSFDW